MSSSRSPLRILRAGDSEHAAPAALSVRLAGGRDMSISEQIHSAREEGLAEGRLQGLREAAEGEAGRKMAAIEVVSQAIADAANRLVDARCQAISVVESEAVDLAFELAEALLQRELAVTRSVTRESVVRALRLVPGGEDIVVRLNPSDLAEGTDLDAILPDRSVKVISDPAVEAGGCIVDAGPCRIDAQIGSALERARELIRASTDGLDADAFKALAVGRKGVGEPGGDRSSPSADQPLAHNAQGSSADSAHDRVDIDVSNNDVSNNDVDGGHVPGEQLEHSSNGGLISGTAGELEATSAPGGAR